jgi:hypothetical protein
MAIYRDSFIFLVVYLCKQESILFTLCSYSRGVPSLIQCEYYVNYVIVHVMLYAWSGHSSLAL